MASVTIKMFREENGDVPFLAWLVSLPPKARAKCRARLGRLRDLGHELRRPEADYLRDSIYELRIKYQRVNYRMLYFFHGQAAVVLSHGLQKEKAIPAVEIKRAIERKKQFESNPEKHASAEESDEEETSDHGRP